MTPEQRLCLWLDVRVAPCIHWPEFADVYLGWTRLGTIAGPDQDGRYVVAASPSWSRELPLTARILATSDDANDCLAAIFDAWLDKPPPREDGK